MEQQIASLQWYERPAYKRARDCIRTTIPQSLEAVKSLKSQLRAAPSHGSTTALAAQISEYLRQIAISYYDIQVALESSHDSYRWTSIPGLASLVRDVAAVTFEDVVHVPGGPHRFVMPSPRFEAGSHEGTIAPSPLPFRGPDMPFGGISHGGPHLFPAGWGPSRLDWQSGHPASWVSNPFAMAPPITPSYRQFIPPAPQFGPPLGFGNTHTHGPAFDHPYGVNREGDVPNLSLPSPTSPVPASSPVLDQLSPVGVNKRKRRNDASASPSIARPRPKRTFSVDMRSMLSDPDDSHFDSQSQRNTAPHEQQRFSLSQETMVYMERMRSTLEDFMKTVSKGDFESSELRPIYTKAFKDRCFAAIERGDFVPIEAFMCSTGEKDLCKKTLPQALLDRRKSRQRPSCKAVANMQSLFTKDFANNVPKDASHLCHQKLYDLLWHILAELGVDNVGRNKCVQALARALERGEAFPLDACWCGNTPHCLLGPAALTDEEVGTYQWMAANDYASFGEIPIEALAGMDKLTDKSLDSVFTTWKVELRDDAQGRKSAWAVPVVSKTLADLYEERLRDAARERGFLADDQSEVTDGSDSDDPADAVKLMSAPRSQMAILLPVDEVIDLFKRFRRGSDHGSELQGMATKFTAALSYFSELRVLARIAYYDDQLAVAKEEAISYDVLDDQRRTLASLRKGIKARTAVSMAEREQLIIWDIENRIAVFMLVVAEESGGNLPDNFDYWAEDAGDQPQSPRGEKRKRGNIYAAVSKTLMAENAGHSSPFKPNNIKEMATQGKVIYSLLKPYGRHWRTVLPLADFCREVDSSAHNSVLKVQPYLWKTLQICLQMTEDLNAWLKDICRDPEAWKQGHTSDMADARAAYYQPGSDAAWGFGVDNGRRQCNWYAQPGDNDRLKVDHRDAISVVRSLEPRETLEVNYSITTWITAMKLICTKQIAARNIKTTPDNQENEYRVFEWLETCASTRDLTGDQKIANRQRWVNGNNASIAVIEDTPGSCLALAVFEKGGKVDTGNNVHVLAHFSPRAMEYADRAKHWAAIISRMFPADYPVLAADVFLRSCVPVRNPTNAKHRLLHSGLMTVMDSVHLSITGDQYPVDKRPDYNLCLRTLLSELAGMAARARRNKGLELSSGTRHSRRRAGEMR